MMKYIFLLLALCLFACEPINIEEELEYLKGTQSIDTLNVTFEINIPDFNDTIINVNL